MLELTDVEVTKVTRKYQIAVPKRMRDELDIEEGDFLAVISNGSEIVLRKILMPSWDDVFEEGERSGKRKKVTRKKVLQAVEEERRAS